MDLQIVLITKKPINQATQKNTCQIFLHKKIPGLKISNPQKFFDHPQHLKSQVLPTPSSRAPAKLHRAYISDSAARMWHSQSSVSGEKTLTFYNSCIRMIQHWLSYIGNTKRQPFILLFVDSLGWQKVGSNQRENCRLLRFKHQA